MYLLSYKILQNYDYLKKLIKFVFNLYIFIYVRYNKS